MIGLGSPSSAGSRLSPGAKAGLGVGLAVVVAVLGAAAYWYGRRVLKKARAMRAENGGFKLAEEGVRRKNGKKEEPVICEGGSCNKLRMVAA
ncbi:hypothetical protein CPLU01_14359 [Colletotrichum plurivorum]|uniref:Uncharacterized protein n=1 Tax=Colletotrichum plurivorum TaxID=2175906 RepID=A0A8H6N025_9PEZI|nr:hypothetical protein CPLU01_14359 [Colletotrichum plurivorum]